MKRILVIMTLLIAGCAQLPDNGLNPSQVFGSSTGINLEFNRDQPPSVIDRTFNVQMILDNYFPEEMPVSLSLSQNNPDLTGFERQTEDLVLSQATYNDD